MDGIAWIEGSTGAKYSEVNGRDTVGAFVGLK